MYVTTITYKGCNQNYVDFFCSQVEKILADFTDLQKGLISLSEWFGEDFATFDEKLFFGHFLEFFRAFEKVSCSHSFV